MSTTAEQLRAFEEALLNPSVRRDTSAVLGLLNENFQEFGSSGRIWNRDQIVDLLANETPFTLQIQDFRCDMLADNVALVTYRSIRIDPGTGTHLASLRSSIWVKEAKGWQVRFHQGTRVG